MQHPAIGHDDAKSAVTFREMRSFDKIRLKLKNTTPAIRLAGGSVVSQPMDNGRLVAVVKFRRNLCYKDDLGGELTVLASLPACRGQIEEVVSSGFGTGPTGGDVRSVPFETRDQPDGIELVFRFADKQIPINVWGVVLQVVYRGRLGDEDDAVVVASKDISEPTFIHFFDILDSEEARTAAPYEVPRRHRISEMQSSL